MSDNPIRTLVRGAYDLQKLRISTGNRVVGNFRAKLGQEPGVKEEDSLDAEAQEFLADLKKRYRRIADALTDKTRKKDADAPFPGDEVISTFTEFALVANYVEMERQETAHFARIETVLGDIPIYRDYLSKIKGIGPAMAGVIISEFDIHKSKYVSSLWKYAGLDVAADGLGRSRRKEHLVQRAYTNAKGQAAERDSITYNPWLKTKLMGVLATSFLRSKSPWAAVYRDYRNRLETNPNLVMTDKPGFHRDNVTYTKMRRHQASLRYMIKMFLIELYKKWREMEGLEVHPPYSEAKLGLRHGSDVPPTNPPVERDGPAVAQQA